MPRIDHTPSTIADLLVSWQETGDEAHLERLLAAVRPILEQVAGSELHRQHVADPAAIEEAVSLVLDHLRRLPAAGATDRTVARFLPRRTGDGADAGLAYVRWLAKERARDVIRASRRRARHTKPFSLLDATGHDRLRAVAAPSHTDADDPTAAGVDRVDRLRAALRHLEPRLATVLGMLLEGKSQTVIATTMQVSEGTVSRMRVRAIEQVRRALRQ